ncbi:Uncharacterized protein APZ42_031464 [Daphnia magna]|uniref:Endonuclease/exonuclease/phosphatase domain-containing protein n=1 Tax=Daphnia magna TaxID=35525 RepID=A0A164MUA9_9CRUS|nr:Uncharacterized protein APZ42_031464 [Daphnia magna]
MLGSPYYVSTPTVSSAPASNFKCMQVNLRHAKAASASLAEVVLENNLDIILIQEPYARNFDSPTLVDIPPGYVAFHSLDREHAYGAVILVRLSLAVSCRAVSRSSLNHVAAVDLHSCGKTFRFISMYVRPSCHDSSNVFRSVFRSLLTPLTVIGVDSNAKSSLWNSVTTDRKGMDLEEILLVFKLNVLNRNRNDLDFLPSGTSFLDITLGTDDIVSPRWFFPTIPSLSDHPFIYFEIMRSTQPCPAQILKAPSPKLPHISKLDKRIQFLYLSVIEPILLYGCSLWAPLLNTKAGCKKARSCQRTFLVSTIGAFKTVSTEALLLLNTTLPIDLRVAELTAMRYRTSSDGFSAASLKWLSKVLPHIKSQRKVDTFNHFSASKCPPWASFLDAILDDSGASMPMPMLPSAPQQLRLLTGHRRIENSMHFCVLVMDYCGVRDMVNGSLDPYVDEPTAIQFCTQEALRIATQLRREYSRIELFSPSTSSFSFLLPSTKLSSLQQLNRDSLLQIAEKTVLFSCLSSSSNPWIYLANSIAHSGVTNYTSSEILRPSKAALKLEIHQSVASIWNGEWASSQAGASTRAFFPKVVQILSGHSLLNSHQSRFGFKDSPGCKCGAPLESTEHFLFFCPRFSQERTLFQAVCSVYDVTWPPSLPSITGNRSVWEAMCAFIHQTRRLRWGSS